MVVHHQEARPGIQIGFRFRTLGPYFTVASLAHSTDDVLLRRVPRLQRGLSFEPCKCSPPRHPRHSRYKPLFLFVLSFKKWDHWGHLRIRRYAPSRSPPLVNGTCLLWYKYSSIYVIQVSTLNDMTHLGNEIYRYQASAPNNRGSVPQAVEDIGSCVWPHVWEKLPQISWLSFSHSSNPFDAPWGLSLDCSTWGRLTVPSTPLDYSPPFWNYSSTHKEFISLLRDSSFWLSLDPRPDREPRQIIHIFLRLQRSCTPPSFATGTYTSGQAIRGIKSDLYANNTITHTRTPISWRIRTRTKTGAKIMKNIALYSPCSGLSGRQ